MCTAYVCILAHVELHNMSETRHTSSIMASIVLDERGWGTAR